MMGKFFSKFKYILFPLILGALVGFIISSSMDYSDLSKPFLSPPGFIFPIVWSILYILMGISYGLLVKKDLNTSEVQNIYYLQLLVNLIWPILFFTFNLRLFSFLWILLLDFLIIIMIIQFYKKNKISAILQLPYLFWSLFASYLNLGIYILNK